MEKIAYRITAIFALLFSGILSGNAGGLWAGYYHRSCPAAEEIVSKTVSTALKRNPGHAASLIRMNFHDCFVRGCDGSILIDSTSGNSAEKNSPANNPSLKGFEVIDEAKSELEKECPGVVSCADILAFAARDSSYLAGGVSWEVPAGRKDGRISKESEVQSNIPAPNFDFKQLIKLFKTKHLSKEDLIILSGAHSLGVSHCSSFQTRLYNFSESRPQDPTLNKAFGSKLKAQCPRRNGDDPEVPMDSFTPNVLDNKYYVGLRYGRGLFTSDQTLLTDASASKMVMKNAKNNSLWKKKFAAAMIKMSEIDVLTGDQGEIRKNCRVVNPY